MIKAGTALDAVAGQIDALTQMLQRVDGYSQPAANATAA